MGCHKTKKEAQDQIAAIEANEDRAMNPDKLSHLARVVPAVGERSVQLLEQLRQKYSSLQEDSVYLWDAEISNDLLDSHFTHMSEKTLQNYAEDAERGVAFLRGHDWHSLPIGYSLSGEYSEGEGRRRVVAGFYTIRTIPDANDLVQRMEVGLVRDVSVGFYGGRAICDLCGQDFWDCRHFPGLKYEEKDGDTVKTQLATFTIEDARLSEVSGVFDGSTPEAMILKAQRAAKAGELTSAQVRLLETQYRVALPVTRHFAVAKPEEKKMNEEQLVRVRALLGVDSDEQIVERLEAQQKRIKELEPQAEDGRHYRKSLIADALEQGVRAQGDKFDSALYEGTLQSAPLNVIQRMRDDWKRVADELLPSGRSSREDAPEERKQVASPYPDEAYA